jgi:hypothetical protein
MNWIERLPELGTFCSVGFECEDCLVLAAARLIYLPDPSFQLPPRAYKREVTPLQRDTIEITTTTHEIPS